MGSEYGYYGIRVICTRSQARVSLAQAGQLLPIFLLTCAADGQLNQCISLLPSRGKSIKGFTCQ